MQQLNKAPYLLWRQDLLESVRALAFRYPQTGINPDKMVSYSDEDLVGTYAYLKGLSITEE